MSRAIAEDPVSCGEKRCFRMGAGGTSARVEADNGEGAKAWTALSCKFLTFLLAQIGTPWFLSCSVYGSAKHLGNVG
jgi:hypothetical protein